MLPAQAVRREGGKVGVAGNPDTAFRNCQRRVLRVRDEFSGRACSATEPRDIVEMARGRRREAAARMRRDLLDDRECHRQRCRIRTNPTATSTLSANGSGPSITVLSQLA